MATITYRLIKGNALTNLEVDTNFQNLNTEKIERNGSIPFTGKVQLATPATSTASVNLPSGDVSTPSAGDLWNNAGVLKFCKTSNSSVNVVTSDGAVPITGNLIIDGNLSVGGDTTFSDIAFSNNTLQLNNVGNASDANASGGGLILKGTTNKTILWDTSNTWTSSANFNLSQGRGYKINNNIVLSETALGTTVTSALGLSSIGSNTNSTLDVQGSLTAGSNISLTSNSSAYRGTTGSATVKLLGTTTTQTKFFAATDAGGFIWSNQAGGTVWSLMTASGFKVAGGVAVGAGNSVPTDGAISADTLTATGAISAASLAITGAISAASLTTTGNITSSGGTVSATAISSSGTIAATGAITAASLTTTGNMTTTAGTVSAANVRATTALAVGTATLGGAGTINASGDVTAYATSDRRLKENIFTIQGAMDKLIWVNGYTFDWTDEAIALKGGEDGYFVRKHDVGLIAQEIENILPEAVATREDGYLAVRYEKLVPILIQAVKELKREIDALKMR